MHCIYRFYLLEGEPGADWLYLMSWGICASFAVSGCGGGCCSASTGACASGMGLPSLDKLSGVYVPLMPTWLGDAGADL